MNSNLVLKLSLAAVAALMWTGCATRNDLPPPCCSPPPTLSESNTGRASSAVLTQAAAIPPATFEGSGWQSLFDGETLGNWQETDFAGRSEVLVESGCIVLGMGSPFTGIRWSNDFPTVNYEIAFDAMRTMGSDFFCGLTVPVRESHCSLIIGGWGGGLVGISSLDGYDASENETTKFMNFDMGRWYRIRLRVTPERLEAWIDGEKLVDLETTGRQIAVRPGDIELSVPLGISAWQTGAAVRELRWRRVTAPDTASK